VPVWRTALAREVILKSILLLLAAAVSAVSADLSGRVLDPSGTPVPNARVTLTDAQNNVAATALTGNSGEYRFREVAAGEYRVHAHAEGFGTAEPRSLSIRNSASQDIRLELARVSTQVQVTAAAVEQTVDEQSKALDVIDAAHAERRAEFSIAEAIRTLPGVRVHQLGGPGSFTRIAVRGLRATDTSILIDGVRLRDAASPQGDATAFVGDLLLTSTDRIEVLRGSGSSLYGTHATAGVVNVITKQGGGDLRGDVGMEGGGLGLARGVATASGGFLADRLRFAGGVQHLNVTKGIDGDDRVRNSTAHGFAAWQIGSQTVLSGRALVSDSFLQLNDTPYLASGSLVPSPNDPDARRSGISSNLLVALSHNWTPALSARVSYSNVLTRRDNRDGPAGTRFEPAFGDSNRFNGRIDTAQARADWQPDRRHRLTGGYEFEREDFDNIARDENPDPARRTDARLRIDQTSHAGFAQAQGRYLDGRLQLLASGRLQSFDLSLPVASGNTALYRGARLPSPPQARTADVSAAYIAAGTGTKVRAHAGNGYRAPALYERFGASYFAGAFSAYGDPALAPERMIAIDGGVDQYLAASRVRLSATYFYTRIQEAIIFDFSGAIVPDTDPWSRFGGYRNTRGGLARGLETSIEATPHRTTSLRGAYTYTNADDRVSQFRNGMLRSIRVSDHLFTATVLQRIGRRFDTAFDLAAASDYYIPFSGQPFRFDGPVKADIVASWTQPLSDRHSLRIYTRVENLLNRTYLEEGFRTPKAWAVGGLKWMF
jgi:vitamin B12 transporter